MKVRGATEAGEGSPSDVTEAETSVEKPIPQLLLANRDGVKVADIDSHEEKLLYSKAVHPAAVAYLAQERRVFWMGEGALMVSSMDGTNTSQVSQIDFSRYLRVIATGILIVRRDECEYGRSS